MFRNEACIVELAERLAAATRHPELSLWVAWLVINAENRISDEEALLFRHLVRLMEQRHQIVDERLARVVDIDADDVWRRLDAETGDLGDIVDLARRVAAVDGGLTKTERELLSDIGDAAVATTATTAAAEQSFGHMNAFSFI